MKPHIGPAKARALRRRSTDAERMLWRQLRGRLFEEMKFRRQQPIGPYVVDFYCAEASLIVELDGGQHDRAAQRRHDEARTEFLAEAGYRVIRFWNTDVLTNIEGVCHQIQQALRELD